MCTLAYAGLYAAPQGKCLKTAVPDWTAQVGIPPLPLNDHVTGASYFTLVPQLLHMSNGDTNGADLIASVRIQ